MTDPFDFEKPARYAVLGNPVAHSRSPRIHALFAHQFKHNIEYIAVQVDAGGFAQAVEQFRANGGTGLNVTVPFKQEAYKLADHLSERAKLAGAVNTFKFEPDGRLFGDNTDGAGLAHDLIRNLGLHLRDKRILILGAGGAVRGVLAPLLKLRPASIVIANRTVAKAKDLAEEFASYGKVEACGFDALKGKHFDLVVNGTAAGLKDEVPPLPENLFARRACAYDMMYGEKSKPFLDWSALHGADHITDGLGMLVEQAAESYLLWRAVRPETRLVIEKLRAEG
jgi:shikimate dehydrogenase